MKLKDCLLPRTMGIFIVLVLALLRIIRTTYAFNLDLKTALVHQGTPQSLFGFSVALHFERNTSWLLVGAPAAQATQPNVERGGAVYRCSTEIPNSCYEVHFDRSGDRNEVHNGVNVTTESKSRQWFGATLRSSGPNGVVVACAPRYVYFSTGFRRRDPVGTCFVARNYFTKFQEYAPCRTSNWGYHRQGSCQAGFSSVFSEDGRKLFIGAVGSWYWQGQVFSQDLLVNDEIITTYEQPAHFDDSYLGYSMSAGEFSGDSATDVVVGVPRGNNLTGKVVIFNSTLTVIYEIPGEQIGSYFGYCLSVVDVDGDGFQDIIISAPMYADFKAKDGSYETGRVYVFYQGKTVSKRFKVWHILDGDISKSRFGLSTSSLGDINRDSFGDFAVGAPYGGPNGGGAVYVYHGSKEGVIKKPSQVIYASEVHDSLRTFGFSLAGGMDLDANEYTDLIVGAYQTDKVVFFKSRPIVSVTAFLTIDPEKINLDEKECSLLDGSKVSCVVVSTCLEYTGDGVPNKLDFEIETVLDSAMEKGARLFFLSNEHQNKLRVGVTLQKHRPNCKKVLVYIQSDVQDKLTMITIETTYSLHQHSPRPKEVLPILNQYTVAKLTKQVNIQKNCGKDNVCIPDLVLTSKPRMEPYVMGTKERLDFKVDIENLGEDAFEAYFFLDLPDGVDFVNIERKHLLQDAPSLCSSPSGVLKSLNCSLGNPMAANTSVTFRILLDPIYINSSSEGYEFVMVVNSTNPENSSKFHDNTHIYKVPIQVKVDLLISGISTTDPVFYNKSLAVPTSKSSEADIGPEIIHLYDVKNRGPSDISEAVVVILWPSYTLSNHHLLYLVEQPEVIGNGHCEAVPNLNPLNLTVLHNPYSPSRSTSIPIDLNNSTDHSIEEDNFVNTTLAYIPVARRRRQVMDNDFQNELSCGPTLCTQIHCQVFGLSQGQHVLFRIRSRLWTETLVEFGFENVSISSKLVAKVTKVPYSVYPETWDYKTYIANTLVNPTDGDIKKRMIPWWIIAAAVCTGVLVLALLVLLLWKVGFFKRKRPRDEFEREPLHKSEKNGMLELGDEAL